MDECILDAKLSVKGYSMDFKDIHRPAILKRDNYKCKHCGVGQRMRYTWENNSRVILDDAWLLDKYVSLKFKVSTIHLSIMHLCQNKACVNHNHLAAGCQCCHLRYDKHQHLMNRLISLASNAQKRKNILK